MLRWCCRVLEDVVCRVDEELVELKLEVRSE